MLSRRDFCHALSKLGVSLHLAPSHAAADLLIPKTSLGLHLDESTADRYHDFVNSVIPLTKQLANRDAQIRETKVFVDCMSELQTAVARAVDRCGTMAQMIPGLASIDQVNEVAPLLEQLTLAQQLLNLSDDLRSSIDSYASIVNNAGKQQSFDDYDVSRVYVACPVPDIDVFDGVYIAASIGGGPVLALITIGISIWQSIENSEEEARIEADEVRLQRDQCKTPEYQAYAKAYSQKLIVEFEAASSIYDLLINPLDVFQRTWGPSLEAHASNAEKKLELLAEDVVADQIERARQWTRRYLAPLSEETEAEILSAQTNLRIAQNARALTQSTCGLQETVIAELEADLALADVFNLMSTSELSDGVKQIIITHRTRCVFTNTVGETHKVGPLRFRAVSMNRTALEKVEYQGAEPSDYACAAINDGPLSFCRAMLASPSSPGSSVNDGGGICYSSSTLNYMMCGAGSMGWSIGDSNSWEDGRAIVAALRSLPGTYSARRGEQNGQILDAFLSGLRNQIADLSKVVKDFETAASRYRTGQLSQAASQTRQTLVSIAQDASSILPRINSELVPTTTMRPPIAELGSRALNERIAEIDNATKPLDRWGAIDSLGKLAQYRLSELSPPDRAAVLTAVNEHFHPTGIVNETIVGPALEKSAKNIGAQLQTPIGTTVGLQIRREINRGLVGLAASSDPKAAASAATGVGLALAADSAMQQGNSEDARSLLQLAASSTDLGLSMVPIVGSFNDAAQFVFGMATGYDYTGHKMTSADFALRSLGIALGLFPLGAGGFRIGTAVVSRELISGANILRETSVGKFVATLSGQAQLLSVHLTESIGEWFGSNVRVLFTPEELAIRVGDLVHTEGRLVQRIPQMIQGGAVEDYVLGIIMSPKNSERILVGGATDAAYRIPDVLSRAEGFVGEIKTNKNLGLTSQIEDFFTYAKSEVPPLRFRLYVMPDTVLSDSLKDALISNGSTVYEVTPNGIIERIPSLRLIYLVRSADSARQRGSCAVASRHNQRLYPFGSSRTGHLNVARSKDFVRINVII